MTRSAERRRLLCAQHGPHTKRRTVMSPAEGAFSLGIPNIYMNQANAGPESQLGRFEPPFAQYAVALRPFKRVLWGLVGSGGFTNPEERKEGVELICKSATRGFEDNFRRLAPGRASFVCHHSPHPKRASPCIESSPLR